MGAIVLDGCMIDEGGVLGAGALLPPCKVIGRNELWVGVPARFERTLSPDARARFDLNFREYVQNAARFRAGLRPMTLTRHDGEPSA